MVDGGDCEEDGEGDRKSADCERAIASGEKVGRVRSIAEGIVAKLPAGV